MENDTIVTQFSDLNEKELQLLCFLAYHGDDYKVAPIAEYRRQLKVSKQVFNDSIYKLEHLGYIKSDRCVKSDWYILVLKELYTNHPEWIDKFKPIGVFSRDSKAEYLCNVVKLVLAGQYADAALLRRPYVGVGYRQLNLLAYLLPVSENDFRFMKMLNDVELRDMMEEVLKARFLKDELYKDTFSGLRSMVSDENGSRQELLSLISAFEFFMYGTSTEESVAPTSWSESVRATKLLYQSKVEESIEAFGQALRLGPKAGAFSWPVLNYLYGIALYLQSKKSPVESSQFALFKNGRSIKYTDENFCIRLLLESIDGTRDETSRAGYVLSRHQEKQYNSFAYLLYSLFGKDTDQFTPATLHSSAFFQHEMSAYLPIGLDAKKIFTERFGGTPAISRLSKRPSWEVAFQEIEASAARQENREKRIAYYVDKYDLVAIVEQTRYEDGWHDGLVLSLSQMIKQGYETMDGTDALIASKLSYTKGYEDAAKTIIPMLADSDRLYYGSYMEGRGQQVRVVNEKPFLAFDGKGSFIEVSTNVATDRDDKVRKHTLVNTGPGEYLLITVNPFQRDIIQKFLALKRVPSAAVASLKKAVESLNGLVDVKDGVLDSLTQTAIGSKGILAIRVVPKKHEYHATIMATAAENGNARFAPAEGDALVYDEIDNITHCINRDLQQEHANYSLIRNYLTQELRCGFSSYTETTLSTAESLLRFVAFVHDNQDKYFMEWPEGKPLRFRGDVKSGDIEVSVKSDMKWFSLEGEVQIGGQQISLEELIRSCCKTDIEGFVKIGEDEYIRMGEELKKHIAALEALPTLQRGTKALPKYLVGTLASMINGLRVSGDNGYTEFMQLTQKAYSLTPDIPDGLNAQLRDYQLEGFRWMCRLSAWGAGACLADDMGLGKTLQAITFLLYKATEGPSLVIAPKSVLLNWEREIARFAPALRCINLNVERKREKAIRNAKAADIVLCTYGVLGTQGTLLASKEWNVACLDEAHQIKNRNTLSSRMAMELKTNSRIILTGTPLQNNLGELWNLFQFINPGLLGTWNVFRDSFMVPALDGRHRELLKEMTMPFILRRTKQEVLTELPDKIVEERFVELSENEQKVYEAMRRRAELKFKSHKSRAEKEKAQEIHIDFFTELMHLREAACSMRLVYDEWTEKSSKITSLMTLLDSILEDPDNNVLVFSQFTGFLELIKPELKHQGTSFLYLDGQTPMQKRQRYVEDFQEGRCRLMLSSLKAGGFGLNLTKANYVIILDPWWNPSVENQAMDRAHRIGQKRVVTVIRLISARTIEEKIMQLHEEKQQLTDDLLEGTNESSKLTYEDIMDMVAPF